MEQIDLSTKDTKSTKKPASFPRSAWERGSNRSAVRYAGASGIGFPRRAWEPWCVVRAAIFSLLALSLQSCSYFSATDTMPDTVPIPETWSSLPDAEQESVKPWLNDFADPQLTTLVEEALAQNPSIQSLIADVEIADEQTWVTWSGFWPKFDASFKGSRFQRNTAAGFSVATKPRDNFGFNLDFLWEVDLWYRLGNELSAAEHDKTAMVADLQAARLSLAANIAKSWFDVVTAKQQLQLAAQTIVSFSHTLEIVEQGYDRGLYQAVDVRLARTNLLNAQGRKQNFLKLLDETTRSLEAFVGRYPSANLETPNQLPDMDRPLPNSLPAELLQRRPDILAAGERFLASDERLRKARKNMLPTIQLSATGGTSTKKFKDIFNPENLIWNVGGNLLLPLIHGGQLFAERSLAEARVKKAAADYAQVVLQAFKEVETTLAADQWLLNQQVLLQAEVVESKEAQRLAEEEYLTGLTDIVTLLESQRRALSAESNLLDMRKQRLQNRVNLYLALGGPVLESKSLSQLDHETQ